MPENAAAQSAPPAATAEELAAAHAVAARALAGAKDALRAFAALIHKGPGGREIALAITKAEESELWAVHSDAIRFHFPDDPTDDAE